jgi:DNA polymerase-3 subunit alpha
VNESGESFTPIEGKDEAGHSIRFGLAAVKGVGDIAAKTIVEELEKNGPYESFTDLVERVDGKAVNKRVLECLIKTGGFDALEGNRAALLADLDRAMGEAQLRRKDREAGQVNLFDMMGGGGEDAGGDSGEFSPNNGLPDVPEMEELEKLKLEKELLGFFLSGHPVDTLGGLGPLLDTIKSEDLDKVEDRRSFRLCGVLADIERRYTKKDAKPWAKFNLLAKEKDFSLPMFTEAFEKYGEKLEDGAIVSVEGVVSRRDGETRMTVSSIRAINQAITATAEEVTWLIDPDHEEAEQFTRDLFTLGDKGEGETLLRLAFARKDEEEGLVMEADSRFSMRLSIDSFKKWRAREPVRGARVVMRSPEPPPERPWAKKG